MVDIVEISISFGSCRNLNPMHVGYILQYNVGFKSVVTVI